MLVFLVHLSLTCISGGMYLHRVCISLGVHLLGRAPQACISWACTSEAYISWACISWACTSEACTSEARISWTCISWTCFYRTGTSEAYIPWAYIYRACIYRAWAYTSSYGLVSTGHHRLTSYARASYARASHRRVSYGRVPQLDIFYGRASESSKRKFFADA